MTSFMIGKVVEPEIRTITVKKDNSQRKIYVFGLLSGRTCNSFEIFEGDKMYDKVNKLKDGDLVIAVVGSSVDTRGKLACYLNGIGDCPDGLRNQLMSLVKKQ